MVQPFYQLKAQSRGFTLVEMIVVIGIVVIVPVIVVANFSQIRLQFALARVSHQFAVDLRQAQTMALSSVPYKDASGQQQIPAGYGVYLLDTNLGDKKYIVYADATPGNQQYDNSDHIVSVVNLADTEPGITIDGQQHNPGSGLSINFSPQDFGTTITAARQKQSLATVTFVVESNAAKRASVTVNSVGLITN